MCNPADSQEEALPGFPAEGGIADSQSHLLQYENSPWSSHQGHSSHSLLPTDDNSQDDRDGDGGLLAGDTVAQGLFTGLTESLLELHHSLRLCLLKSLLALYPTAVKPAFWADALLVSTSSSQICPWILLLLSASQRP